MRYFNHISIVPLIGLNMELHLQSFYGLHVNNCTHLLRPRNPHPPRPHLGSYTRTLFVSQDKRHLFVCDPLVSLSQS
jgi:hypothetical protein